MTSVDLARVLRVTLATFAVALVVAACGDTEASMDLEGRLDAIQRDLAASQQAVESLRAKLDLGDAAVPTTDNGNATPEVAPTDDGDLAAQVLLLREATDNLARDVAGIQEAAPAESQPTPPPTQEILGELAALSARVDDLATRLASLEGRLDAAESGDTGGVVVDRTGNLWFPYLEWSLNNPTFEGNPFDLQAVATFVHITGGDRHVTPMFYDGDDTWRFRFTGTRLGIWTYTTQSADPDLDVRSGTLRIDPPLNSDQRGFLADTEGKWAWTGAGGAFVPQLVMYAHPPAYEGRPDVIEAGIQTFLVEHGFSGFHTNVRCRWFDISKESCDEIDSSNPNPDTRTFEALELLITKVHAAGGMVHIWAWGDETRSQTPLRFGINGEVDRRLQRYIAARLGPIPGWSMGYGFDLDEWVTAEQVHEWRAFILEQLGWHHFFGGRPAGPNRGNDHAPYEAWNSELGYVSFEHHEPTYDVYADASRAAQLKPVMSEDRFRILPGDQSNTKHYTMLQTRRGLWHSAMAGGIANIWGNLSHGEAVVSNPYPDPDVIRTYATFFDKHYSADLSRSNGLTDGVALRLSGNQHYVVYRQDATTIRIDLTDMVGPQPVIAIDTARPYEEIEVGTFEPGDQTWTAPYESDWVLAIGKFD